LKPSQRVRDIVRKIPGTVTIYDVSWKSFFTIKILVSVVLSKFGILMDRPFRYQNVRPNAKLIAITVSTNYYDLLQICLEANLSWFDKWIVITQESDTKTREVLTKYPEVTVLFWDPKKSGAVFDKGSGVRLGQRYAYEKYPNSWYLLIDSDIVLEGDPLTLVNSLDHFSPEGLFGVQRWDYDSVDHLKSKTNGKKYVDSESFHGYFQLYAIPYFYNRSKDAGVCDLKFRALFRKRLMLTSPIGSHLGQESHWRGRGSAP
jgi:hypothetical protein